MFRMRSFIVAAALTVLVSSAAFGQKKLEITPMAGISTAGSVDLNASGTESISAGSGFTWGGTLGYYLSQNVQFEVQYARQNSTLSADFPTDPESIGLGIDQILGNFLFETQLAGGSLAPFLLVGAGAAIFTPDNSDLPSGSDPIDGTTRFQWGIGGGLKLFVTDRVGFRVQGKYKPTNAGSQPEWICGIWTCGVVDATQYLNSGEFMGGLIIRI